MKKHDITLLLLALAVFLAFQLFLASRVSVAEYDEAIYLNVVRNIRDSGTPLRPSGIDGVLYTDHTPLYLYFLAAMVSIAGENLIFLRMATMMFAVGSIILIYSTIRLTNTSSSSFVAALLLALNPFTALYSYFLRMEMLMLFFIVLAVYWLAKEDITHRKRYLFGAGIAVATAVLFKEIALVFTGVAVLYLFLWGKTWRERLVRPLWIGIPSAIALIMWILWGFRFNNASVQAGMARWWSSIIGSGKTADGRTSVQITTWLQQLGGDVLGWALLFLFVISIFAYFIWFRRKLPRITMLPLLYIGLAVTASLIVKLKEPRHVMVLIPMITLSIGYLVDWESVWSWGRASRYRMIFSLIIFVMFSWALSPLKLPPRAEFRNPAAWWEPLFAHRAFHNDAYYGVLRDAGLYLAEHTPPETIITVVHEGPVTSYYANRNYIFLYTMNHPRTLETLADTEYLVVDHVVFSFQTDEEIIDVMHYIAENFEQEQVLQDAHRQIEILHRIPAANKP